MKSTIRIALAGNPNCGKTTLFNALTGARQKVGNYAGVTVEKKEGSLVHGGQSIEVTDLPGLYSLTSYSLDEVVARDFLLHERPDVIVNVVDSSNLERNLYLTLQFLELGLPTVLVLNVADQAHAMGYRIDAKKLGALLGLAVVETVGTKGKGIGQLLDTVVETAENGLAGRKLSYGPELDNALASLEELINQDGDFRSKFPAAFFAAKLLEKDSRAHELLASHVAREEIEARSAVLIKQIEGHFGRSSEVVVSEQRYAYLTGAMAEAVGREKGVSTDKSEVLDRVIMNRFLGLPVFIGVLWAIFQLTFTLGAYPAEWLELGFGWLSETMGTLLPADSLIRSLVVDGIIGGVGGVFSFVPYVVILFLLISLMEDLGYMSRAAFIMDKYLHAFGLHGQSFLPMMVGFGCSVPAIMAARTLKNPKDRIITIMVIPFMSCGAKLPVHVLLAAAFFPDNAANMVLLMYATGVMVALISALVLRKTLLKGPDTPFVMELPPYRLPTLKGIGWHVWDKTSSYFRKAGTVILAASILIWAITTFPQKPEWTPPEVAATADTQVASPDAVSTATLSDLEYSYAGQFGRFMEPAIAPLGFDWKIGISVITGFAAKEVIVSTMGVLYRMDGDVTEESESLHQALQKDPAMNPLVALSLMLFTLLVSPCLAALGTVKAELGWKWLGFSVVFTLGMAWLVSFSVYQIGLVLAGGLS